VCDNVEQSNLQSYKNNYGLKKVYSTGPHTDDIERFGEFFRRKIWSNFKKKKPSDQNNKTFNTVIVTMA
jgi:hypothetical protein